MVPTKNLSLSEQVANCYRAADDAEAGKFQGDGAKLAAAFRAKAERFQREIDRIARSWACDELGNPLYSDIGGPR